MVRTFGQMVAEATAEVPGISPIEAHHRCERDPNTLVIDVRDAEDIPGTGMIPGALNVSYGALTYKADPEVPEEWRDSRVQDPSRPTITTCIAGPLGALAAKLLKDKGFSHVAFIDGGMLAWKEAGLPTA